MLLQETPLTVILVGVLLLIVRKWTKLLIHLIPQKHFLLLQFLDLVRYGLAATGNSTAGYFGGGRRTPGSVTTMEKITYSSDTTAVLPSSARLSLARHYLSATGNSTHGYFGGGQTGPSFSDPGVSRMDKITYSTDTRTALPSSGLSVGRNHVAATGNSEAGFFSGGTPSVPAGGTSIMDKITYSTDTTAAVPGANLTAARYRHAASSARANGLPASSSTPTPVII